VFSLRALKAWTCEGRFSHHGKFWNFENIVVDPAAQRPRPAIWMGAGSEPSIHKVATRGFNLLLDQFAGPNLIKQRVEFFRSELKAVGRSYNPMEVCVARHLVLVGSNPLAHRALANANGFTDGLQRLPTQDHLDHSLSTKRRQAGTLVDVHSALPRNS